MHLIEECLSHIMHYNKHINPNNKLNTIAHYNMIFFYNFYTSNLISNVLYVYNCAEMLYSLV